jgi:hypothetical protein
MNNSAPKAAEVYEGSDGDLTKRYYGLLSLSGPIGEVALNLFRAQKCSARAKVYHGGIRGKGSFKSMAYDRKSWSMEILCKVLAEHGPMLGLRYGWKQDEKTRFGMDAAWVLYVDLPEGQVSFHNPNRGKGPDYPGDWDGIKASCDRILAFCDRIVTERLATNAA